MTYFNAVAIVALFTTWPFLAFLGHNIEESEYHTRIIIDWAILLLISSVTVIILVYISKDTRRNNAVFSFGIFIVLLFVYGPLSQGLAGLGIGLEAIRLAIWGVAAVALTWAAWRLASDVVWRKAMLFGVLAMMIVPILEVGRHLLLAEDGNPRPRPAAAATELRNPRNVYWLVTDAYSRADVLRRSFGWDNSAFLEALEKRGFSIGHESAANYQSTKHSISATLELDYFRPLDRMHRRVYSRALRGFNRTVERFKGFGYRYIHAEPGGGILMTRCGGLEDRCINGLMTSAVSLTEAEIGLLMLTPFFHVVRNYGSGIVDFAFNDASRLAATLRIEAETPFFYFAHILSPHPPDRFEMDCTRAKTSNWRILDSKPKRYVNDIRCLNDQLLALVDGILRTDRTDPIIIISADHGNTFRMSIEGDPKDVPADAIDMVYGILLAMRLPPGACRQSFYASISPVNLFRLVFACLEGRSPDILPDRHFIRWRNRFHEIDLSGVAPNATVLAAGRRRFGLEGPRASD